MTATKKPAEDYDVFVSPSSGHIVGQLHLFLFLDRLSLIVNGIGAGFLLLLTITGLVIWWPGIKKWKRGFGIKLKSSWRRINFDTHNAVGFWTLLILLIWPVSSIYFAWSDQIEHLSPPSPH